VSSIEDRLRDAYRGAADTVRPDEIRQMHEPSVVISMRGHRDSRHSPRRFTIPLAAAAAVALVGVLTAVVIPGALSGPTSKNAGRATSAASRPGSPAGRFVVALAGKSGKFTSGAQKLAVRNVATGATVATISLPQRGLYFSGIATGDGRHYVAELWRPGICRTWLYQFHVNGTGHPSALTPYALPAIRQLLTPIAVSQDNSSFAYEGEQCTGGAADLAVLNVATMTTRSWSIPKQADIEQLSLTADGSALAYSIGLTKLYHSGAYVLPTNSAPGTAAERSRVVAAGARLGRDVAVGSDVISPDGGELYFTTYGTGHAYDNRWQLRVADLSTGVIHLIARYRGIPASYLAANPDVSQALVVIQQAGKPAPSPSPSPSPHRTPSPSPSGPGKRSPSPSPSPGKGAGGSGQPSVSEIVLINLQTGKSTVMSPDIWNPTYPVIAW
jgi:hypothetical protein